MVKAHVKTFVTTGSRLRGKKRLSIEQIATGLTEEVLFLEGAM